MAIYKCVFIEYKLEATVSKDKVLAVFRILTMSLRTCPLIARDAGDSDCKDARSRSHGPSRFPIRHPRVHYS